MALFKHVKHWLHGLLAAIITGGAGAVTATFSAILIDPAKFHLGDPAGVSSCFKMLGACFAINGFIGMCAYLKQSPIPPEANGHTQFFTKPQDPPKV